MSRPACFLLLVIVSACVAGVHLIHPGTGPFPNSDLIDTNGTRGVLLERYLWQQGLYPVVGIWSGGHYVDWADAASRSLWYIPAFLSPDGELHLFNERLDARDIAVVTAPRPGLSILDVAPTACGALGLRGDFDGKDLCRANASQVIVIYVDGLGWCRYCQAKPVMRNLSALEPALACCVYPSVSNVNSAAMVTGACPERSGIDRWENRSIRTDDAVDLALCNGISAEWIDGPRPPVSLRQGIVRVNDTNGDGSFDNEITDRAAADYDNGTRLLYVHLFDTDRTLHAYGPYSSQSLESAARADAMIGRLLGHLKPGTLLIVVSDHGGHDITGGRGDHGSLLPRDMLVPLAIRLS
jgi:hypothetical protein